MASALLALTLGAQLAQAQSRVQYGRITNAVVTTETSSTARNVGTVVGGGIGLVSGSGQSGSNRALRTIGGGAAGRGVGNLASRSQAFEYTVLIDGTTHHAHHLRPGRQACRRLRRRRAGPVRQHPPGARLALLAAAARRPPRLHPPRPRRRRPWPADVEAASACEQAKQQVLDAETDEAFSLAERRMRLLCGE